MPNCKDGTLYQSGSYGSRTPSSVLSDISYGTSTSGKETVTDSSTPTGKAPDIARYKQYPCRWCNHHFRKGNPHSHYGLIEATLKGHIRKTGMPLIL